MELNKIAAAILIAGLITIITGKVSNVLYSTESHGEYGVEVAEKRGFSIEVLEAAVVGNAVAKEKKALASIIPMLAGADIAKGAKIFKKKCTSCHTVDKGGKNKTGPNLWNIVKRDKASIEGFKYSKAMVAKGGAWELEDLNGFLNKPKKWLKGSIMSFAGLKKDKQRANLIAYLHSMSDSPIAISAIEAVVPVGK